MNTSLKTYLNAGLLSLLAIAHGVPASAGESISLRAGYLPITGHAKFFIAQEEGFF